MRPLEAVTAVVGIYTSMLFLTLRNAREAAAETWAQAQKRHQDGRKRRRPIDF